GRTARWLPLQASTAGMPHSSGSGFLQAPLADGLREGEYRARERGAVFRRAHHGVGDQHLDAARAHVFGALGVLAVDHEAVDERAVFERDTAGGGLVAELLHD